MKELRCCRGMRTPPRSTVAAVMSAWEPPAEHPGPAAFTHVFATAPVRMRSPPFQRGFGELVGGQALSSRSAALAEGIVKKNALPAPKVHSTQMPPLWASTVPRAIGRRSPAPWCSPCVPAGNGRRHVRGHRHRCRLRCPPPRSALAHRSASRPTPATSKSCWPKACQTSQRPRRVDEPVAAPTSTAARAPDHIGLSTCRISLSYNESCQTHALSEPPRRGPRIRAASAAPVPASRVWLVKRHIAAQLGVSRAFG